MRKFGGFLALITGIVSFTMALLAILVLTDTIDPLSKIGAHLAIVPKIAGVNEIVIPSLMLSAAVLQVIFAIFAMAKPRGFAAFILFQLFLFIFILVFVTALRPQSDWTTSVIVTMSINGVTALFLLYGMIMGNKKAA